MQRDHDHDSCAHMIRVLCLTSRARPGRRLNLAGNQRRHSMLFDRMKRIAQVRRARKWLFSGG